MKIERWEDHDQLAEGQLVTDATGKLWQVYKPRPLRKGGRAETWLCPFSDEYSFSMGTEVAVEPFKAGSATKIGTYALGDDAPFPLTVVKVVPEDAADAAVE